MKNVPGWKMSHSGKSSGWKRSGVENVRGGTCPRVEKVPEPSQEYIIVDIELKGAQPN